MSQVTQANKHRALPDKESKLFKELLVHFESKQYKKGVKTADSILKKFPNHGETLALKALHLFSALPSPATAASQPKQDEAEAMARLAVRKDMTSHMTWHVLGIMAKGKKDWEEAARAFACAQKQDKDNLPIIRDSITLYLHTRQYALAVQERHHYFTLRPNMRSSWLGLMVAHQLNGDYQEALDVFDGMTGVINVDGASGQEKAQIMLNVIKLCMTMGRDADGLRRLEKAFRDKVLSPRGEASQLRAEMLVKLGRIDDAEAEYQSLIKQNPDNLEYYRGFLRTKELDIATPLDEESIAKVLAELDTFAKTYPKSPAPQRMALTISTGAEFRSRVKPYLINGLEKGIPSLFVDIKSLYSDPTKMAAVGEILEEVIESLQKDASLHDDDSIAPPTTLLWAYYFLALHLAYPLHPNPSYKRALDLLEIALKHTPTLPELYMAKAKILKRAGDAGAAAETMEEARLLDGQDRFLNGKAAKYWLRAGDVKKAEELLAMFTKKDLAATADLTDLQCLWFLQEEGDSYRQLGNLGMALKRYQATATVFQDYEDDQYDFHGYCLRRMTFSAYIALMKYEDQLRSHPAYFKAALSAIEVYTTIHDDPSLTEEVITPEQEAERKKAAKKAQKADQKAKKAAAAAGADSKKEDAPAPDPDPSGELLLKTETPLEEAYKLWLPLETMAAERVETWTAGFEIESRRQRWPAAFKCLLAAYTLDSQDAKLHRQFIIFQQALSSAPSIPSDLKDAFTTRLPILSTITTDPKSFNADFLAQHPSSPAHILGAAQGLIAVLSPTTSEASKTKHLAEGERKEVISVLEGMTKDGVAPDIEVMRRAVEVIKAIGGTEGEVEEFRGRCRGRVPLAEAFAGKEGEKRGKEGEGVEVNGDKAVKADV